MPGGVAVRRQADDAAITKEVVLAGNLVQRMAKVEITPVEAVDGGEVRIDPGLPLAFLHDHDGVRDLAGAADMVEVEMRNDDEVDPLRVAADRAEARADLLARPIVEPEQLGQAGP